MSALAYFIASIFLALGAFLLGVLKTPIKVWLFIKNNRESARELFLSILIIITLAFLITNKSEAGEWKAFKYTEVYLGADRSFNDNPFCGNGPDDEYSSNLGLTQNFAYYNDGKNEFHFNGRYTHQSCVFETDTNSFDAIGPMFIYRRVWR